jgi:hypothetical protein
VGRGRATAGPGCLPPSPGRPRGAMGQDLSLAARRSDARFHMAGKLKEQK